MVRHFRSYFVSLCFAVCACVSGAFERGIAYIASAITPDTLDFASDGALTFSYDIGGDRLSPALLQSLRHEAGVARVAASRKQ